MEQHHSELDQAQQMAQGGYDMSHMPAGALSANYQMLFGGLGSMPMGMMNPQMMGYGVPPTGAPMQPEVPEHDPSGRGMVSHMMQQPVQMPAAPSQLEAEADDLPYSGRPTKNLHITREAHEALKGLRISNLSMGDKLRLLLDFYDKAEAPPEVINPKIQAIKSIIQNTTRIWLKLKIHEEVWRRLNVMRDRYSLTNSEAVYLLVDYHENPTTPSLVIRPQSEVSNMIQRFASPQSSSQPGQPGSFPFGNMQFPFNMQMPFMNFPNLFNPAAFFPGMPKADGSGFPQMFPDGSTPAQPELAGLDGSAAAAALAAAGVPPFFDPSKPQGEQSSVGEVSQDGGSAKRRLDLGEGGADSSQDSKRQRAPNMALVDIQNLKGAIQALRCGQCGEGLSCTDSPTGNPNGPSHSFIVSCASGLHPFQF